MSDLDTLLEDFNEPIESFAEDADPFFEFTLLPDGEYPATLSLGNPEVEKKVSAKGLSYIQVAVQARVTSPGNPQDNRVAFDRVNTLHGEGKPSRLSGLVKVLGGTPSSTKGDLVRTAVTLLQGSPSVKIKTQQQAYCGECKKTTVRGAAAFKDGVTSCPKCKDPLTARVNIIRYSAL